MSSLASRLHSLRQTIAATARRYGRDPGQVRLLAVSKTHPAGAIREALAAGQRWFGENYLQEAEEKQQELATETIEWHFIGRIQGNKTRILARDFDWVHSLCDLHHARRLSEQRPAERPPLRVCVQVNVDREPGKSGIAPEDLGDFLAQAVELPGLELIGLMTLPRWRDKLDDQRKPFAALRQLRDRHASPELPLPELSMGMSGDLEAAIAEGTTILRIGTALFGERQRPAT